MLLLGTWALTVIGTFFSALTVNLRIRELMLPTLVYPLMIPALMSAMTLTTTLLGGSPLGSGQAAGAEDAGGLRYRVHAAVGGVRRYCAIRVNVHANATSWYFWPRVGAALLAWNLHTILLGLAR